ncbi:MAG: RnfABCDGE type electron transport complex subunit D [Deltaproteobacteria bacterium]|nr:RnfABCDGE type electron transport complex subunit D [Deltaproteobacteria bacterium]
MNDNKLIVASTPFLRNGETAHCLMFDALLAALPAALCAIYYFGLRSLAVMLAGMLAAAVTEAAVQILFKCRSFNYRDFAFSFFTREEITVMDGSAVVTGLLLAFTLPPGVPLWVPIVGAVFGVVVAKHLFGGLGYNIFNPALAGRAFLLAAWPAPMTAWQAPVCRASGPAIDAISSATPLGALALDGQTTPLVQLLLGSVGGSLGETSALALMLGAAYLLYKRTITWHAPLGMLGTMALLCLALGHDPLFHLCAGGAMLGAFFMATDPVTSPLSPAGRIIFGCGAGIITMVIRLYGAYPEGVCYALLIMNSLSPLIDRYTSRTVRPGEIGVPLVDTLTKK